MTVTWINTKPGELTLCVDMDEKPTSICIVLDAETMHHYSIKCEGITVASLEGLALAKQRAEQIYYERREMGMA